MFACETMLRNAEKLIPNSREASAFVDIFSSWTNRVSGVRNLHMADKRMSYEYAKSISCTRTWSSGPPVKSANRKNGNAAEKLRLSSSRFNYFIFFIQQVCVKWNLPTSMVHVRFFGGMCCLHCRNTDRRLALPQTNKTDFPKVSISRTKG